ncbi:MAG: leucine-rich repeat protein, partial [Porphyromonas sp.]|nr:leucine-rich repeat protein [Porphyromonas sp.]
AISHASDNLDKLKHLVVVPDQYGEPYRSSGAFAVVFKMRDPQSGKLYALKCFTEEQVGRAEAYRQISEELEFVGSNYFPSMRYYERELFVDSHVSELTELPVLLMDWVEGETMEVYIRQHYRDSYRMAMLCHSFCRMASWLRSQTFAHGDIKPDNIMVDERGRLTLIDCDGMYVPSMAGASSPTMGTQDFRHPLRTPQLFDASIDDFALASIALSLRAIAIDPTLLDRFGAPDRLLFRAEDYLDLSRSEVFAALCRMTTDRELTKLLALFLLVHSEQSLSATAFHLFSTARPEKPKEEELLPTTVSKEELAEAYVDEYGVKFSPDRKRLLSAPRDLEHYTVPYGVKVICDSAFSGDRDSPSSLVSITLPESLTSIGVGAFWYCTSLTTIKLSEGLTSIGGGAFWGCHSLTEINLPESLTSITDNPFLGLKLKLQNKSPHFYVEDNVLFSADCTRLIAYCSDKKEYRVSDTVKNIGGEAFRFTSLTEIKLPEGLTSIGYGAFSFCHSLTEIKLPEGLTSIGDGAFSSCHSLTEIKLPEGLTSIGGYAFSGCHSLTEIKLPEGLTSIGYDAFSGCSSLTEIKLPEGLTSIGNHTFSLCSSLTAIKLPEGLRSIGDVAFLGCHSLTEINLPESLTSIGDWAFRDCPSLTAPTRDEIKRRFGDSVFYYYNY